MEQHPVPQHIASFEFKLFGNLTVRQFVTLAIPMAFAALIFFSPLPPVIRLPLAGLIGSFAFFSALVPIQGRPLDKWVVAFTKAVLKPTQRIWVKEEEVPEYLKILVSSPLTQEQTAQPITNQGRERLKIYLNSLPKGEFTPLDVKERIAIDRLNLEPISDQKGTLPPPIIWPKSKGQSGDLSPFFQQSLPQVTRVPRIDDFQGKMQDALPPDVPKQKMTTTPKVSKHAAPFVLPGIEKKLGASHLAQPLNLVPQTEEIRPLRQLAQDTNFSEAFIPIKTPNKQLKLLHSVGKTRVRKLHFAPPEGFDLSKLPIRGERRFEISEELKKHFWDAEAPFRKTEAAENANKLHASSVLEIPKVIPQEPKPTIESGAPAQPKPIQTHTPHRIVQIPKVAQRIQQHVGVALKQQPKEDNYSKLTMTTEKPAVATSRPNNAAIIPLTDKPNIISGIVTSRNDSAVEGAIFIVRDSNGIPVRALKTNKLGQFLSATQLANGKYHVEVEHDQYHFNPFTINLNGQVLSPIEVKAMEAN